MLDKNKLPPRVITLDRLKDIVETINPKTVDTVMFYTEADTTQDVNIIIGTQHYVIETVGFEINTVLEYIVDLKLSETSLEILV